MPCNQGLSVTAECPLKTLSVKQEENDENEGDPHAGKPTRSCSCRLHTDGGREPVDPEGDPNAQDYIVDDMHEQQPFSGTRYPGPKPLTLVEVNGAAVSTISGST